MIYYENLYAIIALYAYILIQIILESFPVSSSGHTHLFEMMIHRAGITFPKPTDLYGINDELLHLPTIFVLILFFFDHWKIIFRKIFESKKNFIAIAGFVVIADVCTVVFYFIRKAVGLTIPLALGFLVTAMLLFSLRFFTKQQQEFNAEWSWLHALFLGTLQGFALFPGISRFATTFVGARYVNYAPMRAFVISFFIELPLLIAAVSKKLLILGIWNQSQFLSKDIWFIFLVASFIAYGGLFVMRSFVLTNRIWWFSWYLILPITLSICI